MVSSDEWKVIVPIAGVVGAIGIGAYAVSRLITPPCAPGSACANAISPYVSAWQLCANEYSAQVQSDLKNNIPLSSDAQLTYFVQCMNNNAAEIAKTAASYNYNVFDVIQTWGEEIIAGAFISIGIYAFFKSGGAGSIATAVRSGASAANKLLQVITRYAASSGLISAGEASALVQDLPTVSDSIVSYDSELIDTLSADGVITAEDAASVIAEDTTDIATDFAVTIDELAAI